MFDSKRGQREKAEFRKFVPTPIDQLRTFSFDQIATGIVRQSNVDFACDIKRIKLEAAKECQAVLTQTLKIKIKETFNKVHNLN